jgi:cell division septum initiation protein DivIVA
MSPPTPRRIQNVSLPSAMRGYERKATDRLLKDIGASYEEIWLERKALREEVEQLRSEIEELREANRLAREAALSAERSAEEVRVELQGEADTILGTAKAHAEEVLRRAAQERQQLEGTMRDSRAAVDRIRSDLSALFAAALDRLGAEDPPSEPETENGELLVLDDLSDKRQRAQE